MIEIGPTGRIVKGDVLDVNPIALERKLQDYDRLLYLKWNPSKRRGWGMWEVRRRPEKKTAIPECVFEGNTYFSVQYAELDLMNHILDVPHLNYQCVERIKAMDTWGNKNWINDLEYQEEQHRVARQQKAREEMRYNFKQNRSAIRDLREALLSGTNPAELARYWGSKG